MQNIELEVNQYFFLRMLKLSRVILPLLIVVCAGCTSASKVIERSVANTPKGGLITDSQNIELSIYKVLHKPVGIRALRDIFQYIEEKFMVAKEYNEDLSGPTYIFYNLVENFFVNAKEDFNIYIGQLARDKDIDTLTGEEFRLLIEPVLAQKQSTAQLTDILNSAIMLLQAFYTFPQIFDESTSADLKRGGLLANYNVYIAVYKLLGCQVPDNSGLIQINNSIKKCSREYSLN